MYPFRSKFQNLGNGSLSRDIFDVDDIFWHIVVRGSHVDCFIVFFIILARHTAFIADRHRAVHMCVGRGFTSMESEDVGDIDGAVAARFESACENRPRELAT